MYENWVLGHMANNNKTVNKKFQTTHEEAVQGSGRWSEKPLTAFTVHGPETSLHIPVPVVMLKVPHV